MAFDNYYSITHVITKRIKFVTMFNYSRLFKLSRFIWQLRPVTNSCGNNYKQLTEAASFVAIHLRNKQLLRVSGPGSFIYLQSLLTNDMRKLLSANHAEQFSSLDHHNKLMPVIYSFILSAVGKVLCDLFVYRGRYIVADCNGYDGDGEFILEVDKGLATAVKRLLLGYNVNKNIKVELANDFNLWAILPASLLDKHQSIYNIDQTLSPIDSDDLKLVADPRIGYEHFGYRFLTRLGGSRLEDLGPYIKCQSNHERIRLIEGRIADYIGLKYQLGLAEGQNDIRSGHYFPFEMNGDFINAISLNKGLYTSEEKTIKIYSTQPIKQRVFPIEFLCSNHILRQKSPAPRTLIYSTNERRKVGQLHRRIGRFGIASLAIPLANNNIPRDIVTQDLYHIDTNLKLRASIPKWWPKNFDQIYLNAPKYPECLFNFDSQNSHVRIT
ncbi:iron-sulfur cluster assembly factor IBA57, mitochondrial [Dermatophagoides farinae]|nr:putative transferase CAF17 homolog, mitochondrial [Dermatophagoides farinae]